MELRKTTVLITAMMVAIMPLAAAQDSQPEKGPGLVGADSPLYGLETAWDNAAVSIGLKKASDVAQERAAEAKSAADKGKWNAAQKAAKKMSSISEKAGEDEKEGLRKAESVLQGVKDDAPEEAQEGLQTALDNVRKKRGGGPNKPESLPTPEDQNGTEKPGDLPGPDDIPTNEYENRSEDNRPDNDSSEVGNEEPTTPPSP